MSCRYKPKKINGGAKAGVTTNVIDLASGLSVTDSRWSNQKAEFLLFIDDAGFEKIVSYEGFAFTFAGNGYLIQVWKNWLASNPPVLFPLPPVEMILENGQALSMAVCIVQMNVKNLIFHRNSAIVYDSALFAGTGATQARAAWEESHDAKLAVQSAISIDNLSGGCIKYLEFSTGQHNLNETATIGDVGRLLAERGTVMYHTKQQTSGTVVPVRDAAANDPHVREAVEQLASGTISANAPCNSMYNAWAPEELKQLEEAMRTVQRVRDKARETG